MPQGVPPAWMLLAGAASCSARSDETILGRWAPVLERRARTASRSAEEGLEPDDRRSRPERSLVARALAVVAADGHRTARLVRPRGRRRRRAVLRSRASRSAARVPARER